MNKTKDRLLPYKLLAYLLYSPPADGLEENKEMWFSRLPDGKLLVNTGHCARAVKMKSDLLWKAFYWLNDNNLIIIEKTRKRGEAIVTLIPPKNLSVNV